MARHGAIVDVSRALANRNGIENLALARTLSCGGARVPEVVLTAQVLEQTTFEDAATLHEQTAVDRFGRHLQVRIARKGTAEPARDLLGRPLLRKLVGDRALEDRPGGQTPGLRSTAVLPGLAIGDGRSIDATPTVARHFAADRGWRTAEDPTDCAQRLAACQLARDFFPLCRCQRKA